MNYRPINCDFSFSVALLPPIQKMGIFSRPNPNNQITYCTDFSYPGHGHRFKLPSPINRFKSWSAHTAEAARKRRSKTWHESEELKKVRTHNLSALLTSFSASWTFGCCIPASFAFSAILLHPFARWGTPMQGSKMWANLNDGRKKELQTWHWGRRRCICIGVFPSKKY